MAEKVLFKLGGTGGHGTFEVVDTDGSVATRLNGEPINEAAKFTMPVPATAVGTATLTTAQILNGLLIGTPVAPAAYTLPLAADLDAAVNMAVGEAFVFNVRNDGATGTVDHITMTTNTGWTLSGSMVIHQAGTPAAGETAFGMFAARKTAAGAFTLYRIGA
jgi:hypothetical protein